MNLLKKLKEKLTPLPKMTNEEILSIEQTLKSIIDEHAGITNISKFWIHKYFTTNGNRVNHNLAMYLNDAKFYCCYDETKNEKNSASFLILRNRTKGINIVEALAPEVTNYADELNSRIGDRYVCIPVDGYIRVAKVK